MGNRRRTLGESRRSISAALSDSVYQGLDNWAWKHRMSISAACEELISRALMADEKASKSSVKDAR